MPASSGFFDSRNPQAVLKHGVLTRYAHYFSGRAGRATAGQVAFIDGYAGEGRYADGTPGSPLLLATQVRRAEILGRTVKLALVEPDARRRARLTESLAERAVRADVVDERSFQEAADDLLARYDRHAVLLFVDPFGLGLDQPRLISILKRRSARQPIDVLYHFSLSTVARMGRASITSGANDNADQLDRALGPVAWREEFARVDDGRVTATEAAVIVARRFGEVVRRESGVRCTAIPVRQRPTHQPKYLLMLFSGDPSGDAHWDFADVASTAHEEWLLHCDTEDFNAYVNSVDDSGQAELFPLEAPKAATVAQNVDDDARQYFEHHLPALFAQRRAIRPIDAIEDIYGLMLGRARTTHVRTALRLMHQAGLIDDNCARDFWRRTISWTSDRPRTP